MFLYVRKLHARKCTDNKITLKNNLYGTHNMSLYIRKLHARKSIDNKFIDSVLS